MLQENARELTETLRRLQTLSRLCGNNDDFRGVLACDRSIAVVVARLIVAEQQALEAPVRRPQDDDATH